MDNANIDAVSTADCTSIRNRPSLSSVFADYPTGIYEITSEEYKRFNEEIGEYFSFKWSTISRVYMLKSSSIYMFAVDCPNREGEYCILNGGAMGKKLVYSDLHYYLDHMELYSQALLQMTQAYYNELQRLSQFVKSFGGEGTVHGSIVDIDFFNHINLDPLTGATTCYYSPIMGIREEYDGIIALLTEHAPLLLKNAEKVLNGTQLETLGSQYNRLSSDLANSFGWTTNNYMYRNSRLLRNIQHLREAHVLRNWNDLLLLQIKSVLGRRGEAEPAIMVKNAVLEKAESIRQLSYSEFLKIVRKDPYALLQIPEEYLNSRMCLAAVKFRRKHGLSSSFMFDRETGENYDIQKIDALLSKIPLRCYTAEICHEIIVSFIWCGYDRLCLKYIPSSLYSSFLVQCDLVDAIGAEVLNVIPPQLYSEGLFIKLMSCSPDSITMVPQEYKTFLVNSEAVKHKGALICNYSPEQIGYSSLCSLLLILIGRLFDIFRKSIEATRCM